MRSAVRVRSSAPWEKGTLLRSLFPWKSYCKTRTADRRTGFPKKDEVFFWEEEQPPEKGAFSGEKAIKKGELRRGPSPLISSMGKGNAVAFPFPMEIILQDEDRRPKTGFPKKDEVFFWEEGTVAPNLSEYPQKKNRTGRKMRPVPPPESQNRPRGRICHIRS